jgi:hypothetical protein
MLQALFEKHKSFLKLLKKKGFREERVTTIGWYDLGKSHDPGIQQEPAVFKRTLLSILHSQSGKITSSDAKIAWFNLTP